MRRALRVISSMCAALMMSMRAGAAPTSAWQTHWSEAVFAQAAREHRFVLLDLHAVWCHWCHVMDMETYGDPRVRALLAKDYVSVSIDADSDPDLASRYGDWGWPATIVLAADGTEIVKRRGYIPAPQMASLLRAIIDDPRPGPSVAPPVAIAEGGGDRLAAPQRAALTRLYERLYDDEHGGWGDVHKFIDAAALELTYSKIDDGDVTAPRRARQTLDANLNLIDPVWGGVYQYSDEVDWLSPHFEKLLSFQADDLRMYAEAYARWHDPRYLAAAASLYGYMTKFLAAADGGFYSSQDADVSATMSGHEFYSKDDAARRAIGMPRIDTHEYARETGSAIRALCTYYDVTGTQEVLATAMRSASWLLTHRLRPDGSFRHGIQDRGGPFLDDVLAASEAFIALYRSTGDGRWLAFASSSLDFIDGHLGDARGGFVAAPRAPEGRGVFHEAVRQPDQNASLVRVANLAYRYTGNRRYKVMARHGMKYLAAFARAAAPQFRAEILLADHELSTAPVHITVVGGKSDPQAQALHRAALRYPAEYMQIDWWDPDEGRLPNPDIQYPRLEQAAAFACTGSACSTPVFDADGIEPAVRAALHP
jgi:uncharacterized protein YyaL (SSP411 family)